MTQLIDRTPDSGALAAVLATALEEAHGGAVEVAIVAREQHPYASSYPLEIVTCRLADGRELRLMCKYQREYEHNDYGHRGGIAREAAVYRHILRPLGATAPRLVGSFRDDLTGETWLFTEYLASALRVSKPPQPDAMALAARWIARFHAAAEQHLAHAPTPPVPTYDRAYYLGWVERTHRFSAELRSEYPWLQTLCARFATIAEEIATAPLTVIHGEYCPHNVLYTGGIIRPVDWESAALAVGEIDLAMLVDDWPMDVTEACEQAYAQARWPDGAPPEHARRLAAAQLYKAFRWLGDRPESVWNGYYFEQLRSAGEQLALI